MKKILVLGAGIFQVPLIKKVKTLGYKAIVASVGGDYPGISIADVFVEADTTDTEAIFHVAKKHQVSAIITTGTDVSIPTMAAVTERLNLKGPSLLAAKSVSSKTQFRKFLYENRLNCPAFQTCYSVSEALNFFRSQSGKIVLKPDDASGSRGVSILSPEASEDEVVKLFGEAKGFSRNGVVCAEGFIPGKEVGGDAFLIDGQFVFFTTTQKHMNGIVVKGHTVPGSLSGNVRKSVKEELLRVVRQLGYRNGPINFDVIIGEGGASILEMGLRNGGNGIVNIIKQSQGVDLAEMLIDYVLDNEIRLTHSEMIRDTSSYVFGAEKAGRLVRITSIADLKLAVPEIMDMILTKKAGDHVEAFTHNANLIGYLILDCGAERYVDICQRIEEVLKIEVEKK